MDVNPPHHQIEEPTSPFSGVIERVHGWRSMTGLTIALGSAIFPLIVLSAFGNSLPPISGNNKYVSEIELTSQTAKATLGLPSPCQTESTGMAPGANRVTCSQEGNVLQVAARQVDRTEGLPTLARRALREVAQVTVSDDHPVTTSSSGNREQARIQYQHENGNPVEVAVLREKGDTGAYVIEVQGRQPDLLSSQPQEIDENQVPGSDHISDSTQQGDNPKPGDSIKPGETGIPGSNDVIATPTDLSEGEPADAEAVTKYLDEIVSTLSLNQARSPHSQAVAMKPGRIS